jgi:hypothetical protein
MLWIILGPNREDVAGGRTFHNEGLHNWHLSSKEMRIF